MWYRIGVLIVKELQVILRDRKTRIILIVPPILQMVVFAFASTLEVRNISLGVYNNDTGMESRDFLDYFRNSPSFTHLYFLKNESEVRQFIDEQRGVGVLRIHPDFSRRIADGSGAGVQVVFDGRRTNVAQIVAGYIQRIAESYNQALLEKRGIRRLPGRIIVRHQYNPNLEFLYYTLPCLVSILCMTMGIAIPALSVAREREEGTFDQILVSPLNSLEIIVGKTVPSMIIGFAQATCMIIAAVLFFRLPFEGSILLLYVSMFVFIASVIGVGLFISSLSKTQQQAILGAFVFAVPAVLVSGYATPVENMPHWLQTVSLADPLRYFLVIMKGIFLKNMTWDVAFQNLYPLAILTVLSLSFAGWFFKKKLD